MVPNMELVKEVCREEDFFFQLVGKHKNMAEVVYKNKKYFFAYAATPFNTEDVQRVCTDKFLTYCLLHDQIRMPETKQYLRPDLDEDLHGEIKFKSKEEIITDIQNHFTFPYIVKMNAGSQGKNVFLCREIKGLENSVSKIFEDDWALLAQGLIEKEREFRVFIVNNEVELVYTKGGENFFDTNSNEFKKVVEFLLPLKNLINLGWAGLDVILDKKGELCLIEINTKPSFESAVKHHRGEILKPLYKKAFQEIL